MLMKLLVSIFERARSRLTVTHSNNRIPSDSDIEIANFDAKSTKYNSSSGSLIIRHQPRSSLSKWLCTTPISVDKPVSSLRSNKVRRSSSWRSLKERGNNTITSRTYSVDELHRNNRQFQKARLRDPSHSPIKSLSSSHRKLSNGAPSHTRFDRLSSTLIDYPNPKNKSPRRKQFEQQIFSTSSHHSGGGDSGYSEEHFTTKSCQRPLHTSCPHCHCEQRSSFNNYKKLSSTESSPSDIQKSSDNLLSSRSYSHTKPIQKLNLQTQQKPIRTLTDKRRRNLSCDGSLWTRTQTQKPIIITSSPVFSEPNHLPLQRHFTTIGMTRCRPSNTYTKSSSINSNVFGELNLAAIELDSLRTSLSSSSYSSSSSSSSINNEKTQRKQLFLVWNDYQNLSLLSKTNETKTFSVRRGDQVRLLKRIDKSTLLVRKEDDGSIGCLPQTCLAHHQINSFLSLKGLRETVL